MTITNVSTADTAKQIRASLKTAFPGTKFSVRCHNYAGGSSITAAWADGPLEESVNAAVQGYRGAVADQSGDFMVPISHVKDGERVHYSVSHIFTKRDVSAEVYAQILPEVLQALGLTEEERGRSFATPNLVYRECPAWRWESGDIREFVHALAAVRSA